MSALDSTSGAPLLFQQLHEQLRHHDLVTGVLLGEATIRVHGEFNRIKRLSEFGTSLDSASAAKSTSASGH
jgi:hypothetical protein